MYITQDTAAVVTGAASGLGAATAAALARKGAKVAVFDLDESKGQAVAKEIGGQFIACDVSNPDNVEQAFAQARSLHGQERILVNCAGIAPAARTARKGVPHDPALFSKTIGINLIGSFLCASQAAAGMGSVNSADDQENGIIIHTASVAAYDGQIGQTAYAASKGGIVGLTLPMARDLAKDKIRVMAIAPGIFMTPLLEGMPQEVQDSLATQVPYPSRLGRADEFASLALSIIENQMLNGTVIRLDGAIRMGPK